MQEFWSEICSRYPPSLVEFFFIASIQLLAFWVPATIYLAIDLLFPDFSNRHKIQSERRQPTWEQIKHCVQYVAMNDLISIGLQLILRYIVGLHRTLFIQSLAFPSLATTLGDFVFGLAAREISFYYIHRLLHHPSIYAYVHKKHHKFTAPMAFSAQYAHPFEHIIANVLPIFLPLAMKGTNILSFGMFLSFELWEAAADHSGYDFVKLPPAAIHDLHHEKFRVNYSTIGIMDWIHGTDVVGWDRTKKAQSLRKDPVHEN
ncbi:C-4 sterol methyl oxidase [Aureobasidium pullulans EXF-150]|uniref:C-4 sterol methyl oxidase n=1 Tax=Aureobasidium pullulans EXF-150 TaxID=1043002 RepID=A0A074WZ52_AURPU|nr:C-4 sterol methyl oxidase [Aureobasidium pullulans EXF-150]KEQ78483.1 C-4 sterol methyl oxidase [Aureobasidium pullulans EXF-150]